MSDYCSACRFDPRSSCPITALYWAFLERKKNLLADNRRMALPLASLAKRSPGRKRADRRTFERVRQRLAHGESLTPQDLC